MDNLIGGAQIDIAFLDAAGLQRQAAVIRLGSLFEQKQHLKQTTFARAIGAKESRQRRQTNCVGLAP